MAYLTMVGVIAVCGGAAPAVLTPEGLARHVARFNAMEESISGSRTPQHLRPTINSYMFGNAQAIANVLRDHPPESVTAADYFDAFRTYVRSHRMDGKPYIGEYLDKQTGAWLKGNNPRSRWYNHSTFADLVIGGVVGLRPHDDEVVEVHPLLPPGTWDWFCLDDVRYHGRTLTVQWDRDGKRYGRGAGLSVLSDGQLLARAAGLGKLTAPLGVPRARSLLPEPAGRR